VSERLLQFSIPADLYDAVDEANGFIGNVQSKLRISLALGMFMFGEISLAKAAELAAMSLTEFMGILEKPHIPAVIYTDDELADDLRFIEMHVGGMP